jgi:NitT/TauT family transport system substrate-binding protein
MRRPLTLAMVLALATLAAGCAGPEVRARGSEGVLRLGVFSTLAHAPAHVAIGAGIFDRVLGATRLEVTSFESGADASVALLSGSIDAAYMGPWPTASLSRYAGSLAVVSGVAAGGVSFVVRAGAGIEGPDDLRGRRIAVPDINNTQEVALRSWLHDHGLRTREEGGDVAVVGLGGFDVATLLEHGRLDGAWLPEPYPTYLSDRGIADRLVDEATLWPPGELLSTNLVVSTTYLREHPDVVRDLVAANVLGVELCRTDPDRAKEIVAAQIASTGGPALSPGVLDAAWAKLEFTWDPLPASFERVAEQAYEVGLSSEPPVGLASAYQLDALNDVLNDEGFLPVEAPA